LYIYVNGESAATPVACTKDIDQGSGALIAIGTDPYNVGTGNYTGSLSLLRISATAPTPKQIADIYAAEKPLFAANAKCLLAANQVNDLAYDTTSGLLYVADDGANAGLIMRGLENVKTLKRNDDYGFSSNYPVDTIVAAGGVSAVGRVSLGAGVNLPSIDVRADLNEGATTLPDDGKLHFSGVTTDATDAKIGYIPIAENERVTVRIKVSGQGYNDQDGQWIDVEQTRTFYRDIGGTRSQRASSYKISDESTASMDVYLSATGNDITVQVIGHAINGDERDRMVWTASVEVQRISEKTYER
jgi:hypothetical protein